MANEALLKLCEHMIKKVGVSISTVRGKSQSDAAKYARYYLAKRLSSAGMSITDIGKFLNSSRGFVYSYIKKYEDLVRCDKAFIVFLNKLGDLGNLYVISDREIDSAIDDLSEYAPRDKVVYILNQFRKGI